jgi:hypothetical protein
MGRKRARVDSDQLSRPGETSPSAARTGQLTASANAQATSRIRDCFKLGGFIFAQYVYS